MKKISLIASAFAIGLGLAAASAQQSPPSRVPDPCQPSSAKTGSTSESQRYANSPNQPMEHSAVLPDAGGERTSAAPTVQQNGKSVDASTECPKEPNRLPSSPRR
jgi:hypothetical protein